MKDAKGHGSNGRGGRLAKPIPGHAFHKKSDAELRYIMKDASEAGRNAQEMGSDQGVNKYADQVNDAATVLGYRARGGSQDMPEPSNAAAAAALASGPKSAPAPVHDGASGRSDDVFDKHQTKIAKDTLRMSPLGASLMGGMNHEQARAHLRRVGWSDARISKHENG